MAYTRPSLLTPGRPHSAQCVVNNHEFVWTWQVLGGQQNRPWGVLSGYRSPIDIELILWRPSPGANRPANVKNVVTSHDFLNYVLYAEHLRKNNTSSYQSLL